MKKKLIIIVISVLILALIAAGITVAVIFNNKNSDKNENKEESVGAVESADIDYTELNRFLSVKTESELNKLISDEKYTSASNSDGSVSVYFVDTFGYDGTATYYLNDDKVEHIDVSFFDNPDENFDLTSGDIKTFDMKVRKAFGTLLGAEAFEGFNVLAYDDKYFTDEYPQDHYEGVLKRYSTLQYTAKDSSGSILTMDVYLPSPYILGAKVSKYYDISGFENFDVMIDYSSSKN